MLAVKKTETIQLLGMEIRQIQIWDKTENISKDR